MKKFLLSLCAIAVAGACLFMTSCKDDDDPITYSDIASALKNVMDEGATYKYFLNGHEVIPPTPEQLQKEFQNVHGDFTLVIEETTPDGGKNTATTNGTITGNGTLIVNVPTDGGIVPIEVHYTETIHNGGAAGTK